MAYKIVSFDIFDTLILRCSAKPSDLFMVLEKYLEKTFTDAPKGFCKARISAERKAAEKAGNPVTIGMIYDILKEDFGDIAETIMKKEIELEYKNCRANPAMLSFYRKCFKEKKKVILTSDMYLTSDIVKKMLDKCEISGYEKLYISCEQGRSKADGGLYKKILSDFSLRPGELLHIGDNLKSDNVIPMSMGIHTRHVKNDSDKLCCVPDKISDDNAIEYRMINSLIKCTAETVDDKYTELGIKTFGPLLTGFTYWLKNRLAADNIHDVYFMSRDGYVMKKAFDSLNLPDMRTHYLYCSRRSFSVPLIWKAPELSDIFSNITIHERMTLRTFLIRVGMEPDDYSEKTKAFDLDLDRIYEDNSFKRSEDVLNFYNSIKMEVISNSRKEYEALVKYIRSFGMDKKIAVVDIGRHGTMQNALVKLLKAENMDIDVHGYYVGVSPNAENINNGRIKASGYLHEKNYNEDILKPLSCYVTIFESVFLAQHGSVKKFIIKSGEAMPVLYDYEYDIKDNRAIDEIDFITKYQNGALMFLNSVSEYLADFFIDFSPKMALYNFTKMGIKPNLWEANLWGSIRFFDDSYFFIARPREIYEYLISPKKLINDFKLCPWKIGFMKRIFKIPMPYFKIYGIMKNRFHKRSRKE